MFADIGKIDCGEAIHDQPPSETILSGTRRFPVSGRSPGLPSSFAVLLPGFPVVSEQHRQAYSSGGCAGLGINHLTGLPVSPVIEQSLGHPKQGEC